MTVFETMQEEELKILSPLFFLTDSWVPAVALYIHGAGMGQGVGTVQEPTVYPSPLAGLLRIEATFLFVQNLSPYFSFSFSGQRRPRFWLATILGKVSWCLSENRRVIEFSEALLGLPEWLSGKESACQCRRWRRPEFDPWVGKSPWRRKWLSTLAFLPWLSHGQSSLEGYSLWGGKESVMTEQLSMHARMIPQSSSNR